MVACMEKRNFRNSTFHIFRSPQNNPTQLIIFHGICEHPLRYLPFIKKLNNIGFDCTLIDHPGHGQNILGAPFCDEFFSFYDSLEKDLEKATHQILDFKKLTKANSFQKEFLKANKKLHIDDIISYQREFYSFLFREKIYNRNQKTILLGQSMGGLVAATLTPMLDEISGTILMSPAFKAIPKPINVNSFTDRMRHKIETIIIKKSDESFSQETLFSKMALNSMIALNPTSNCSWAYKYISDIAEINDIFSKDPFIGRKVSLKFLHSIQALMKKQRDIKENFSCSVFIEFGLEDKIINAEGSKEFISNRLNGPANFFKALKGFQPHEIHNSKRQNYLLNDIEEWAKNLA